jgi:hypothetical protein
MASSVAAKIPRKNCAQQSKRLVWSSSTRTVAVPGFASRSRGERGGKVEFSLLTFSAEFAERKVFLDLRNATWRSPTEMVRAASSAVQGKK